jgi:signal transduction histidine kinase/ActR/RegA family two-component response regulator
VVDVVGEKGIVERVAVAHADSEQELFARRLMQYTPVRGTNHPIWQVLESGCSQLLAPMPAPMLEEITRDDGHLAIAQQMGICSVMFVPLMAPGRTLGVMTLISSAPDHSYTALDVSLAEELARRCAMAVENARLHRQALDALQARDEFLAVLSHELRSPLTAILGWIHLLKNADTCDEETRIRGLEVIERNTKTQAQLIEDLLDVSRIITGRLKLEMLPVSLSHIVRNTLNSLAPMWQAKDIKVSLLCHADPNTVLGDAARLQQIAWNLVTNAIKFTPPRGHIEIAIEAADGKLELTVTDSGEGIPAEFVPYVFDRFRQADSSSTRRHGGLGLGLSIVRHLTEMHGGTALVSSPGKGLGATFTIRLPQNPDSMPQARTSSPRHTNGSQGANRILLDGLNILLVEDGDDARELIATILRGAGAHVTAAAAADEAMSAFLSQTPDVIVSDIAMPGEDGYDLIRRIKEWESEHHLHIPSIALTAYAGEHDRLQALSAGFTTHLAKPVEPSKLVSAVFEVARLSNAGSATEASKYPPIS